MSPPVYWNHCSSVTKPILLSPILLASQSLTQACSTQELSRKACTYCVSSFPLRPGTTWDQQLLLQEPQNMGNSKAVQGALMGLPSPHLIMGQHNQPIVLASSSEVSVGSPQTRGTARTQKSNNGYLLPFSAPSAFPAVQYLSQPQPQPYAVHGHFQPTQTGDNPLGRSPSLIATAICSLLTLLPSGFLQPGSALSLQKQMEHANQQTSFSDSVSMKPWEVKTLR